jgi:hypothetical protein
MLLQESYSSGNIKYLADSRRFWDGGGNDSGGIVSGLGASESPSLRYLRLVISPHVVKRSLAGGTDGGTPLAKTFRAAFHRDAWQDGQHRILQDGAGCPEVQNRIVKAWKRSGEDLPLNPHHRPAGPTPGGSASLGRQLPE